MNIVHISTTDCGGAGLCAYRICKSQREAGIDSSLIVMRKTKHQPFIHAHGRMSYFLHSCLRKVQRLLHLPNEINTCRDLGRKHHAVYTLPVSPVDLTANALIQQADLIHIHWVGGFLDYPSFFPAYADKPIVFTLHDESMLYGIASIEKQWLPAHPIEQKYYQLKLHHTQQIKRLGAVFLSQMNYQRYSRLDMLSHARTTIIYNMVDSTQFCPTAASPVRKRLHLHHDKLFAFCAYNINEQRKGLDLLSQALMRIDPCYKILAIGKNRAGKQWDNVISLGCYNDARKMSEIYTAADYFVMPSLKENFAQAPIEAMACGLPLIAFPCSGTEELITPANGVRCDDFTIDALERGIRKALSASYSRESIRQDIIQRFSPQKITNDYLSFYRQMMAD